MKWLFALILAAGMILFWLWWAIGASFMLANLSHIVKAALLTWINLDGWFQLYTIGGTITVIISAFHFAPEILKDLLCSVRRPTFDTILFAPFAVVGWIALLIPFVVFVYIGWPFVAWLAWTDIRERQKRKKTMIIETEDDEAIPQEPR